jgi:hypothetical protein
VLNPGDAIDVWVVDQQLGSGGMGSVYRCHNRAAPRIVAAVKVLDPSVRSSRQGMDRFVREAETLFRLDHPNIVKVRNIRMDLDTPFIEMEFVEGQSLEDLIEAGPMPLPRALRLFGQIASALAYLHAAGVHHRDLKPANILVQSSSSGAERVKIVDFGLASDAQASAITVGQDTFGTVSYAPPEWVDPASLRAELWDIYAVGVIVWEMLTGTMAFPLPGVGNLRQQSMQVIFAKQNHPLLDPGPPASEGLRALIGAAAHPDPAQRIPSAAALVERLAALEPSVVIPPWRGGPSLPPSVSPTPPPPSPIAPAPIAPASVPLARAWVFGGLLGLGFLGAAVGAWLFLGRDAAPAPIDWVVHLQGVSDPKSVRLWGNGVAPASVSGFSATFHPQPGPLVVRWAVGADCPDSCATGDCPPRCGVGESPFTVAAAPPRQDVDVSIPAPTARAVTVPLPALPPGTPVRVRLGDTANGSGVFDATLPGSYPVEVQLGTCPADATGCWPTRACPPGCLSGAFEVEVPWGDGPWTAATEWPVWTPAEAAAPAPVVATPSPSPSPAPPSSRGSGWVTVAQLADWLGQRPEFQRDDTSPPLYLAGWQGAEPPAGASGPVRGVSWALADAYCRSRGGLPRLSDEPRTWDGGPGGAWRVSDDGAPAVAMSDGTHAPATRQQVSRTIAFRCR